MTTPARSTCVFVVGLMLASAFPAFAQQRAATAPSAPTGQTDEHAGHQQEAKKPGMPASPSANEEVHHRDRGDGQEAQEPPPFIPTLTDEDRKAAFPDVVAHAVHDNLVSSFVLFDRLEWKAGSGGGAVNLDTKGWVGRDRDRLWFRAEADAEDRRVGEAQAHVMYGRLISRWWDLVAGIRQDVRPGPSQTWAAIGVQGLAPYWFEVEATAYVSASGRTLARLEVEYELLLTNRLVLQPLLEFDVSGKSDPERSLGAGLSSTRGGLRLRYEIRREVAPYFGVTWNRKWGKTADFAKAAGERTHGTRLVTGLRLWL